MREGDGGGSREGEDAPEGLGGGTRKSILHLSTSSCIRVSLSLIPAFSLVFLGCPQGANRSGKHRPASYEHCSGAARFPPLLSSLPLSPRLSKRSPSQDLLRGIVPAIDSPAGLSQVSTTVILGTGAAFLRGKGLKSRGVGEVETCASVQRAGFG